MASDFFKSNIVTGLAAGIGATLLAPVVLPFLGRIAKPLTKSAIKAGINLYEKGVESFAELSETVDDLVAEAKVELEGQAAPAGAAAAAATAPTASSGKSNSAAGRPPAPPPAPPGPSDNVKEEPAEAPSAKTDQARNAKEGSTEAPAKPSEAGS